MRTRVEQHCGLFWEACHSLDRRERAHLDLLWTRCGANVTALHGRHSHAGLTDSCGSLGHGLDCSAGERYLILNGRASLRGR